MRQQVRFRLGIGLSLALVAIAAWKIRSHMFQGRPEAFWFAGLTNVFPGNPSFVTWSKLGTNAVPLLARALESREGPLQKHYRAAWRELPASVQHLLPMPLNYSSVHDGAFLMLVALHASPATNSILLRPIVHCLKDDSCTVRMNALSALAVGVPTAEIDQRTLLPPVLARLDDTSALVRMNAAVALGSFTHCNTNILSRLRSALMDLDSDVRIRAAMSLVKLAPDADTQSEIIPVAEGCIVANGPHGSAALGQMLLIELGTNSPSLGVRQAATNALAQAEDIRMAPYHNRGFHPW